MPGLIIVKTNTDYMVCYVDKSSIRYTNKQNKYDITYNSDKLQVRTVSSTFNNLWRALI